MLIDVDGDGKAELLEWNKDGLTLLRGPRVDEEYGPGRCARRGVGGGWGFRQRWYGGLMHSYRERAVAVSECEGKFEKVDANLPSGRFEKAVWLDYDHDYDLDLLLLGEKSVLLRNQGPAGFVDHTADFPFVAGHAMDAVSYRWMADSKAFDLVVSYKDHAGVLYSDKLTGKYEAVPVPELPAGAKWLDAADVNDDSWLDIVSSAGTLLNRQGKFEQASAAYRGWRCGGRRARPQR